MDMMKTFRYLLVLLWGTSMATGREMPNNLQDAEYSFVFAVMDSYLTLVGDAEDPGRAGELYNGLLLDADSPIDASGVVLVVRNLDHYRLADGDDARDIRICEALATTVYRTAERAYAQWSSIEIDEGVPSIVRLRPPEGYPFPVTPDSIDDEAVRGEYEPRYNEAVRNQDAKNRKALHEQGLRKIAIWLPQLAESVERVYGPAGFGAYLGRLGALQGESEFDLLGWLETQRDSK